MTQEANFAASLAKFRKWRYRAIPVVRAEGKVPPVAKDNDEPSAFRRICDSNTELLQQPPQKLVHLVPRLEIADALDLPVQPYAGIFQHPRAHGFA